MLLAASDAAPDAIVVGVRRKEGLEIKRVARFGNWFADRVMRWIAGQPLPDTQSGFRVYPVELLRMIAVRPSLASGFAFESEILIDAARLGFRTVAVDIPAIYGSVLQRPSHFRPVPDVTRIVLVVAGKLLAWGMDPIGLWRSLTLERQRAVSCHPTVD